MPVPIITLISDLGEGNHEVAQIKGVILSLAEQARIIDISHSASGTEMKRAAYALAEASVRFPVDSVHVAVVEAHAAGGQKLIYARIDHRHYLGPDNGVLSLLATRQKPAAMVELVNNEFWLGETPGAFPARDVLAPVAASLALGTPPRELGPPLAEMVMLEFPEVDLIHNAVSGMVVSFDSHGNLITDISGRLLTRVKGSENLAVGIGEHIVYGLVKNYRVRPPGTLAALIGVSGFLELAVVDGNAAKKLKVDVGMPVTVSW